MSKLMGTTVAALQPQRTPHARALCTFLLLAAAANAHATSILNSYRAARQPSVAAAVVAGVAATAASTLIHKSLIGATSSSDSAAQAARLPPPSGDYTACAHSLPPNISRQALFGPSLLTRLLPSEAASPTTPDAAILHSWKITPLCAQNYAVMYSGLTKTPLLVMERLNKRVLSDAADESRTNEFFADPRLSASIRSDLEDYRGSRFDRGHLAPAADQPDQLTMVQSFALSNMVPQDPTHNRKIWSKVESDVRKFARRAPGDVYVLTGVMYLEPRTAGSPEPTTIGKNRVWVPSHLYKMVFDATGKRGWVYWIPNRADARISPPLSLDEFAEKTGIRLLNPA